MACSAGLLVPVDPELELLASTVFKHDFLEQLSESLFFPTVIKGMKVIERPIEDREPEERDM
jgi:hypothetical protein